MSEQDAGVGIAEDYRIVHHEEDHAVLAYVTDDGHPRRRQREQDARDAKQREGHDEQHIPEGADPDVRFHFVLAVQVDVGKDEPHEEQDADDEGLVLRHTVESLMPHLPQVKEEGAAEDVVEEEPQGVALPEEPVADGREEQDNPMKITDPLDEMHEDVGREEGQEEPKRTVAEGETALEPGECLYLADCLGDALREETQPEEGHDEADDAPREVWHEETPDTVAQVGKRLARDAFVEVAGLEEEETHEEERPKHRLPPPRRLSQLRLADSMKRHHPEDAESAEQVEGIAAFLHVMVHNSQFAVIRAAANSSLFTFRSSHYIYNVLSRA